MDVNIYFIVTFINLVIYVDKPPYININNQFFRLHIFVILSRMMCIIQQDTQTMRVMCYVVLSCF